MFRSIISSPQAAVRGSGASFQAPQAAVLDSGASSKPTGGGLGFRSIVQAPRAATLGFRSVVSIPTSVASFRQGGFFAPGAAQESPCPWRASKRRRRCLPSPGKGTAGAVRRCRSGCKRESAARSGANAASGAGMPIRSLSRARLPHVNISPERLWEIPYRPDAGAGPHIHAPGCKSPSQAPGQGGRAISPEAAFTEDAIARQQHGGQCAPLPRESCSSRQERSICMVSGVFSSSPPASIIEAP